MAVRPFIILCTSARHIASSYLWTSSAMFARRRIISTRCSTEMWLAATIHSISACYDTAMWITALVHRMSTCCYTAMWLTTWAHCMNTHYYTAMCSRLAFTSLFTYNLNNCKQNKPQHMQQPTDPLNANLSTLTIFIHAMLLWYAICVILNHVLWGRTQLHVQCTCCTNMVWDNDVLSG